jgi:hypothetical protein
MNEMVKLTVRCDVFYTPTPHADLGNLTILFLGVCHSSDVLTCACAAYASSPSALAAL